MLKGFQNRFNYWILIYSCTNINKAFCYLDYWMCTLHFFLHYKFLFFFVNRTSPRINIKFVLLLGNIFYFYAPNITRHQSPLQYIECWEYCCCSYYCYSSVRFLLHPRVRIVCLWDLDLFTILFVYFFSASLVLLQCFLSASSALLKRFFSASSVLLQCFCSASSVLLL